MGMQTIDFGTMGVFSPEYTGTIEFEAVPPDFADRMARRVEGGLLVPGSRSRANYVVRSKSTDGISFGAVGFWTAYNLGFNEVELRRTGPTRVLYRGSFRRWAVYAAINSFLLAAFILIGLLVWPAAQAGISRYGWGWWFIGGMLVFFGLLWPWLLVAVHRRFVSRALERIVRQVVEI